jgi:hypothetical protein
MFFPGKLNITTSLFHFFTMCLQFFVEPWPIFQFLNPIYSPYDSLGEGSALHKAATYTQNNTNTE